MEHREERIVVETERYRVTGRLQLPREGYRSRLSDYLNAAGSFVALTDVEVVPIGSIEPAQQREFMALAVDHIVLAMPADPPAGG